MKELLQKDFARKGGLATLKKYSKTHLSNIGIIGGNKTKERHGLEFYQNIGKKSAEMRKQRKQPQNDILTIS